MILEPEAHHLIWLNGKYVAWSEAKMNITANHYGIGVFEGLRSYKTSTGPAIFRLKDHTDRLFNSANILKISIPYAKEELNKIQQEIILKNNFENAYIRPFVFYDGIIGLSLYTHALNINVMIIALKWAEKGIYNQRTNKSGIKIQTSSFSRNHVRSVFSKAKTNGNYINAILALQEVKTRGADDVLLLDQEGFISECSGSNIFLIRNNILYTPETTSALEGITRDTIIQLAEKEGFLVKEKRITRDELYIADEVFITGTASEVTPVVEVDQHELNYGKIGPITMKLQTLYANIIHGENSNYSKWLSYINPNFMDKKISALS